jgi:Tol biopolymer transport system component
MRVTPSKRRLPAVAALLVLLGAACTDAPTSPIAGPRSSLKVSVQTSGGDLDDDGYEVVVTSERRQFVAIQSVTIISGIGAGTHTVGLEGVSPNCTVTGTTPLSVTVPAGQTVEVGFVVVCVTTGFEVTTRTTGGDNPFGYHVVVYDPVLNTQSFRPIGANTSLIVSRLPARTYTVGLQMHDDHCSVSSDHPITVQVSNRTVTPVLFEITCVHPVRPEKIAYVVDKITNASQEGRIALVNPDGSGGAEVSSGDAPSWSPDGATLVFSSTQCGYYYGCNGELILADPETRSFMVLSAGSRGSDPAWAPTGDVIAFISEQSQLYVVKLDGSPAFSLGIPGGILASEPAWSPDGRQIVFQCLIASRNYDLCVINRDGTGLVRLTSDEVAEDSPAWSPDGSRIAFTRNPGQAEIAMIAADGGAVTRLTDGFDPAWSRDGSKLVFARADGLFTINVDGSNLTRLTTGNHHEPAWRP